MPKAKNLISVNEPPKIPRLNIMRGSPGVSKKSDLPSNQIQRRGKINQTSFHTQHKGGPSGSGK